MPTLLHTVRRGENARQSARPWVSPLSIGGCPRFQRTAQGRLEFSGKLDDVDIEGWATQFNCDGRVLALFAVAPDAPTAETLADTLASTRCLAAGEAPQTWPDAPATTEDRVEQDVTPGDGGR